MMLGATAATEPESQLDIFRSLHMRGTAASASLRGWCSSQASSKPPSGPQQLRLLATTCSSCNSVSISSPSSSGTPDSHFGPFFVRSSRSPWLWLFSNAPPDVNRVYWYNSVYHTKPRAVFSDDRTRIPCYSRIHAREVPTSRSHSWSICCRGSCPCRASAIVSAATPWESGYGIGPISLRGAGPHAVLAFRTVLNHTHLAGQKTAYCYHCGRTRRALASAEGVEDDVGGVR
jgi:hypothetical protein